MVTARILLRAPFTAMQTGLVSHLLRQHAKEVDETRKGRFWEFTVNGARCSLTVFQTLCRPDMLGGGMTHVEVPEIIVLSYPSKTDRDACSAIATRVAELLGGKHCGVDDAD